jgi:hypothetical protein
VRDLEKGGHHARANADLSLCITAELDGEDNIRASSGFTKTEPALSL